MTEVLDRPAPTAVPGAPGELPSFGGLIRVGDDVAVHYTGARTASGPKVWRHDPAGRRPLRHIAKHSPTGMEWGYAGSAPADLALSLLIDYLRLDPVEGATRAEGPWAAPDGVIVDRLPYLSFKSAVIARLPRYESWTLTAAQLDDFLADGGLHLRGRAA